MEEAQAVLARNVVDRCLAEGIHIIYWQAQFNQHV
jgi:hypothetical protein